MKILILIIFFALFAGSAFAQACVDMPALLGYIGDWKTGSMDMPTLLGYIGDWKTGANCTGQAQMATASRITGAMPLAVFFDAVDETDWTSGVVQPRGFANQLVQITGVKITTVGFSNPLGNATLSYAAANKTLSWNGGTPVVVSAGKGFALQSTSGAKLYVWVNPTLLPVSGVVEQVEIVNGGVNADWTSFHYEWDFGDPPPLGTSSTDSLWYWQYGAKKSDGSWFSKNKEFGWNAAHVYENSGPHLATLKITDDEGTVHEYTQIIDVQSEPSGGWATYYFSATGNDTADCLSQATACKTWEKAKTLAGPNVQLLFKRGEQFAVNSMLNAATSGQFTVPGPFMISAYGTWEPPVWMIGATSAIYLKGAPDFRIVDMDITGDGVSLITPFQHFGNGALMLRTRLFYTGDNPSWESLAFVVDTENFRDMGHAIYNSGIKRMVILGDYFVGRLDVDCMWVNRLYSSKVIVSHNNYEHQCPTKGQLRLMSGMWKIASFNHFSDEDSSQVINLETDVTPVTHGWLVGNVFDFRNGSTAKAINMQGGIDVLIAANRLITNRDSTFTGSLNFQDAIVRLENVRVLGNTMESCASTWSKFDTIRPDHMTPDFGLVIANNAYYAPTNAYQTSTMFIDAQTGFNVSTNYKLSSNYNLFYAPLISTPFANNGIRISFLAWQALGYDLQSTAQNPLFVDAANGDLRLQAGSPAINAGTNQFLAWNRIDADGKPRGSQPDIGALEYP